MSPEGIVFAVDIHGRVLKYDPEKAESVVFGGICKDVFHFSSMVYSITADNYLSRTTRRISGASTSAPENGARFGTIVHLCVGHEPYLPSLWFSIESEPFTEDAIYQSSSIPSIVFLRNGRLVMVAWWLCPRNMSI